MYSWHLLIDQKKRKGAQTINRDPKLNNLKPQHYNYNHYRMAVVLLSSYMVCFFLMCPQLIAVSDNSLFYLFIIDTIECP